METMVISIIIDDRRPENYRAIMLDAARRRMAIGLFDKLETGKYYSIRVRPNINRRVDMDAEEIVLSVEVEETQTHRHVIHELPDFSAMTRARLSYSAIEEIRRRVNKEWRNMKGKFVKLAGRLKTP